MGVTDRQRLRTPPKPVAKAALKGLRLRNRFRRGGTASGLARAKALGGRAAMDAASFQRLAGYFARHRFETRARSFGDETNPSASYIAWLLHGGDEGAAWVARERDTLD